MAVAMIIRTFRFSRLLLTVDCLYVLSDVSMAIPKAEIPKITSCFSHIDEKPLEISKSCQYETV
jgi:hypothetical protein